MESSIIPAKNVNSRNDRNARLAQKSGDRWKWMAASLAATAAPAVLHGQTQVINFSGNTLYSRTDDLSLNFDAGAGHMDLNLSGTIYFSSISSTRFRATAEVFINSVYLQALATEDRSYRRLVGTTTSGKIYTTYGIEHVQVHVASSFSYSDTSYGGSISKQNSANIPITFTDPNINDGVTTSGTLLVTCSAIAEGDNGLGASVSLVSLTYQPLSQFALLESLKTELTGLVSSGNSKTINNDLNKAIAAINKALDGNNWQAGNGSLSSKAQGFFSASEDAAKTLETLAKAKGVSGTVISQANSGISLIVAANIQLATQTYNAAVSDSGNAKDLSAAHADLTKANSLTGTAALAEAAKAWKLSIAAEK